MQLPKQDHYEIARDAALAELTADLDAARLDALGAQFDPDSVTITLPVLCWQSWCGLNHTRCACCRTASRCRSPGRSSR